MSNITDRLTALEDAVNQLRCQLDWVMLERGRGYKVVDTSDMVLPPHVVNASKRKRAVVRFCQPPPPKG